MQWQRNAYFMMNCMFNHIFTTLPTISKVAQSEKVMKFGKIAYNTLDSKLIARSTKVEGMHHLHIVS